MPTIITHAAVPLALGVGLGHETISRRLLLAGMAASVLPDLDVVAFRAGIPYAAAFGHRGFSHSLLFAVVVAMFGVAVFRRLQSERLSVFLFLLMSTLSHPLLDAFTNGGLGVALLWPWSSVRYFAPVRMIQVSPIGLSQFLSHRGWVVLQSELQWVWMPVALAGLGLFFARNLRVGFRGERPGVRRP